MTEADWRLFTTLVRFDAVYVGHFKCNLCRLVDYPNLWDYTRALYQQPGIAATVNMMHIKRHYYESHARINPSGIAKPFANYTHVVTAEGAKKLVFCAGQVAADEHGAVLPPDDFDAQAAMVMKNLTRALEAGGATLADVTKVTIYIVNPHDVPKARGILDAFKGNPPGSTLCILRGLANPNFLLEIEAIAAV